MCRVFAAAPCPDERGTWPGCLPVLKLPARPRQAQYTPLGEGCFLRIPHRSFEKAWVPCVAKDYRRSFDWVHVSLREIIHQILSSVCTLVVDLAFERVVETVHVGDMVMNSKTRMSLVNLFSGGHHRRSVGMHAGTLDQVLRRWTATPARPGKRRCSPGQSGFSLWQCARRAQDVGQGVGGGVAAARRETMFTG